MCRQDEEEVLSMDKNVLGNVRAAVHRGPPERPQRLQVMQDQPMSCISDVIRGGVAAGGSTWEQMRRKHSVWIKCFLEI